MRFEQIEQGNKNIRISIIDSDGRAIMPTLNAQLNVQIRPNESDASVPLALVIFSNYIYRVLASIRLILRLIIGRGLPFPCT